jgi:hypothetical protein
VDALFFGVLEEFPGAVFGLVGKVKRGGESWDVALGVGRLDLQAEFADDVAVGAGDLAFPDAAHVGYLVE